MSKRLVAALAVAALGVAAHALPTDKADDKGKKKVDTRLFEMRTYYAAPGKMKALHARFRDHTCKLFVKHGMTLVGFWSPADAKEADAKMVYILAHKSQADADKSWKAFRADPAWKKVLAETEKDGKLLAKPPEIVWLNPTDYSPLK